MARDIPFACHLSVIASIPCWALATQGGGTVSGDFWPFLVHFGTQNRWQKARNRICHGQNAPPARHCFPVVFPSTSGPCLPPVGQFGAISSTKTATDGPQRGAGSLTRLYATSFATAFVTAHGTVMTQRGTVRPNRSFRQSRKAVGDSQLKLAKFSGHSFPPRCWWMWALCVDHFAAAFRCKSWKLTTTAMALVCPSSRRCCPIAYGLRGDRPEGYTPLTKNKNRKAVGYA